MLGESRVRVKAPFPLSALIILGAGWALALGIRGPILAGQEFGVIWAEEVAFHGRHLYDYKCAAHPPNVRPKFLDVLFFWDVMLF